MKKFEFIISQKRHIKKLSFFRLKIEIIDFSTPNRSVVWKKTRKCYQGKIDQLKLYVISFNIAFFSKKKKYFFIFLFGSKNEEKFIRKKITNFFIIEIFIALLNWIQQHFLLKSLDLSCRENRDFYLGFRVFSNEIFKFDFLR